MRTCKKCNKSLPLSKFYKVRTYTRLDGTTVEHQSFTCKYCLQKRADEKRSTPEGKKKVQEYQYKSWWKQTNGIDLTKEQALAQLELQNFACGICKDDLSDQRWHYDHDHVTLELRKILCHNCNVGIGHFEEDVNLLRLAIQYLESFKEKT